MHYDIIEVQIDENSVADIKFVLDLKVKRFDLEVKRS